MSEQDNTTASEATAQVAEQVQKPAAPQKAHVTGNLIFDTATELASLSKTKALNMAKHLSENIELNYFKLGGLLRVIQQNQWFDGFPTFDAFVVEKFGFQVRKAHYLISIYTSLVDKQIPWEKVGQLGWTKLKDLAPVLTLENLDDWVAKAEKCTVSELQALLKAGTETEGTAKSVTTSSETIKLNFKVHVDQNELIQSALAKAKGEMNTEFDNVALAAICSGYLAGSSGAATVGGQVDLKAVFAQIGFEQVLGFFEQVFPNIDLTVDVKEG